MNEIALPRYAAGQGLPLERALSALFEVDQYDDWVPDVVYYRDQRERLGDCQKQQRDIWAAGALPASPALSFTIPRERSEPCPSMILPLSHRVAAYRVAGAMAPRLEQHAVRDRVHGFELKRDAKTALFSGPADGIVELWDGAVAKVGLGRYLQLIDVDAFNASCRPQVLLDALQSCGAWAQELLFLRGLLAEVDVGLPSIDDAFAYLYNFYLQPADARLRRAKVPFLRHRDMYLVFDEDAVQPVMDGISMQRLSAREMVAEPEFREFVYTEAELPDPVDLGPDFELPSETGDLLWLELPHARIKIAFDLYWTGEAELMDVEMSTLEPALRGLKSTAALVAYAGRPYHELDGVSLQPLVRRVHPIRESAVTKLPPFDGAPRPFLDYRDTLAPARERLLSTVFASAESHAASAWHATWASALLSDLGPLAGDAADRLATLADGAPPLAGTHLRLLLARCSDLPPDRVLPDRMASGSGFELRAALLAASYLARRGHPGAWSAWRERRRGREPLLTRFLDENLEADA